MQKLTQTLSGQGKFPDAFAQMIVGDATSRLGDPLESLERHVDFAALAASVDHALSWPHRYFGGRPPYPTEWMIHLLVIQQLFKLPDA